MEQKATVTKIIDEKTAEIRVERPTACGGSCASCGGTCSFQNIIIAKAVNETAAAVGDRVRVESRTSSVLKAAVLVYILPVVTFFAGYFVSAVCGLDETASVIISVAAFIAGIAIAVLSQRSGRRRLITFIITEIV